jgi:malectin (di-glucose binding ER protein)
MEDRTILEQFPLPIARGYRRYLNASESKERHDLGYFLFEIYLKYLSATAIAAYLASPERDHRVNAALKGLLRPSLGEWLRFLRECLEFAGSREDSDPVTRSIAVLFKEKDARAPRCLELFNRMRSFRTSQPSEKEAIHLEGFLEELVAFRNRTLGHGAPLDGDHYRDFADLFGPAFAELLDRSPFLTARRLVSFDSTRVEEGSWVECAVIEFMGNQPVRRQKPHRVRYGEPVPKEKLLYLLSVDMGAGESSGLLAIDPLLVAHREDVYVLNEARGVPEYISYSTGEHNRPSDLGGKQGELFEKTFPPEHVHPPGYRIPLPPGEYQVTLHFADVFFWKRGSRSFGALLEGQEVLADYEPLAAGLATAEAKTFRTRVDDGLLDIVFVRAADNPLVSAIEIQRLR